MPSRRCIPWLIGGSADLDSSTKTKLTFAGTADFTATDRGGRNLHFGVREHAMGAICNGLALSKLRPYGATFLIFSDYLRPTIRLAALMELPTIFVFTHDSIGVGEDGPTHQPVEQMPSLRAIPGLLTIRPGDANEAAESWRVVLGLKHQPAALILSRQAMPTFDRSKFGAASGVAKGAYILADAPEGQTPQVILMSSGSELALAVQGWEALAKENIPARVVSMPCWELFELQDQAYKDEVLPPGIAARVADRAGRDAGVGALRRPARRHHRHAHVRRLGAPEGAADQVRLHARTGRRGRQGADRPTRLRQGRQAGCGIEPGSRP